MSGGGEVGRACLVAVLFMVAGGAAADEAGLAMSCKAVRAAMDREPPSRDEVMPILRSINGLYEQLDTQRAAAGKSRIFVRMSDKGRADTVAMATARCERHPAETLREATVATYEGIEALGRTLGTND